MLIGGTFFFSYLKHRFKASRKTFINETKSLLPILASESFEVWQKLALLGREKRQVKQCKTKRDSKKEEENKIRKIKRKIKRERKRE